MWIRATLFSLALVALVPLAADANPLPAPAWTISASLSDPFQVTDQASGNMKTLYLWYLDGPPYGMARAEMGLTPGGDLMLLDITHVNGFLLTGPHSGLAVWSPAGCVFGPVVVAEILVIDLPGTLCLVPSTMTGACCTADCGTNPTWWEATYLGFSCDGSSPCEQMDIGPCFPHAVGVEPPLAVQPWGETKAAYR